MNRLTNEANVEQKDNTEKLILSSVSAQKTSSGKCTLYDASYDYGKLDVKVKVSNKAQRPSNSATNNLSSVSAGESPLAKEYFNYQKIIKSNPMKGNSYFAKYLEFLTEAPIIDFVSNVNDNSTHAHDDKHDHEHKYEYDCNHSLEKL